jgi:hypothetical protein
MRDPLPQVLSATATFQALRAGLSPLPHKSLARVDTDGLATIRFGEMRSSIVLDCEKIAEDGGTNSRFERQEQGKTTNEAAGYEQ